MMNYDLAMMALEGLTRSPLTIQSSESGIVVEGSADAFKHLARLMLLLGGDGADVSDGFELQTGIHAKHGSPALTLRRV
jgi:hypothetical protein